MYGAPYAALGAQERLVCGSTFAQSQQPHALAREPRGPAPQLEAPMSEEQAAVLHDLPGYPPSPTRGSDERGGGGGEREAEAEAEAGRRRG